MKKCLKSFFTGPFGDQSIKRAIAVSGFLVLSIALFLKIHFPLLILDPNLISAISGIVMVCIIGTAAEKFSPQIKGFMDKMKGDSGDDKDPQ